MDIGRSRRCSEVHAAYENQASKPPPCVSARRRTAVGKHRSSYAVTVGGGRSVHPALNNIVPPLTPSVLLVFASAWTAMFTGCISDRSAQQIAGAVVRQVIGDATDLGVSATAFRLETKRWPKDYAELSAFVQRSSGKFQ